MTTSTGLLRPAGTTFPRVVLQTVPACPECGAWFRLEERCETWMTTWLYAVCDVCGWTFRGVECLA